MRSQKSLRDELKFIAEFNTFFDVLQQVAVARLRRIEEHAAGFAAERNLLLQTALPLVPASLQAHPLIRGGGRGTLLVVMTSDEGLVGPLHSLIVREAHAHASAPTRWVLVGQRGRRLLGDAAAHADVMPMPSEDAATETLSRLSRVILSRYRRDGMPQVWLVGGRYLSATRQDVSAHPLLPLPLPPAPARPSPEEVLLEPAAEQVLEALAECWVQACCVEAYWSSRRAECAAKAMQAEASRQALAKRSRAARHEFFKAMHERVDVLVRQTSVVQRQAAHHHFASEVSR